MRLISCSDDAVQSAIRRHLDSVHQSYVAAFDRLAERAAEELRER